MGTPPMPTSAELPPTGAATEFMLGIALGLLTVGAVTVAATRRRP